MKFEIFKDSGKISELEVPLYEMESGAEIYVGRSDDCHIILEDQQISRHHAMLFWSNDCLNIKKLSDLGSIYINGVEQKEVSIKQGDKVSILDYVILASDLPTNGERIQDSPLIDEPTAIMEGPILEPEPILEDNIPEPEENEEATEVFNEEIEASDDGSEADEGEFEENEDSAGDDEFAGGFEEENSFSTDGANGDESEDEFNEDLGFGGDDDGFSDDSGFGGDDEDSTQVYQSFAKYYLIIDGEYAPFDKYQIEDSEIYIGRDPEKCQIVLNDPEVSGRHALIKKTLVNCTIEDLDSSNGTIFNGERINKSELGNNDNFQIGSTIFTVKISSDLIESEKDMLMPVDDNQEVEVEEVVEEEVDYNELDTAGGGDFSVEPSEEKSLFKRIWKDPKKRRIAIVVGLLLVILLLSEEESGKKPASKAKADKGKETKVEEKKAEQKKELPPEVIAKLEENYALALAKYEGGEYYEAKEYLEIIRSIDPTYKDTETLRKLVQQGHEELLRLKAEEQAEKERKKRQLKVKALLEKTQEAVKNREVQVAESLFSQILELDPENIDVPQLKLEIEAYQANEKRKKEEEQRKKALRKAMVDALSPGKTLFLKEEWYKAVDRLSKFTQKPNIDEDLMKEATDMLKQAKVNLSAQINPLLGRARSYREGQDLKRAYETYGEVLKYDPSNEEALTEREKIFDSLRTRSMKVYREALISESLSLFEEAREKFEEVQQISPVNSEYYNKATERLKNYLE
ncbi:MAG: hypothetical protein CME67_01745 [Halobacteriovoraceae bacterium]|nr:hypothetical protein [Halobacteriovoraceae bacterium]